MTLTLQDVRVRYGSTSTGLTAVDGVDLSVPDGTVLALLGPSGCGKSTLLRAIAGIEPLSGGRICWDGTDLGRVAVHRRGFGLMFQDGALFGHRSVAGNVGYGLRGWPAARRRERVQELLELVGLPGTGDRGVGELSGGQRQRVALARALAPGPRLLLLDEPLAALDAGLRERLLEVLRDVLAATATTAVFVTHDQAEAFGIADRVALMREGRIHQLDTPAALWRRPVDAWAAQFVGYRTVLPAGHGVPGLPDGPVALRPAALEVVDGADGGLPGSLPPALVRSCRPTPDGAEFTVELAGAVLPALGAAPLPVGTSVRLAVRSAGLAALSDAGPAVGWDTLQR